MSAESGTVVVVEDDPHIADLVDLYLRREGFRVLLADDGEKGLDTFAAGGPLHRHPRRRPPRCPRRLRRVPRHPCPQPGARPLPHGTRRRGRPRSRAGARRRRLPGQAVLARGSSWRGCGPSCGGRREGPAPQEVITVGDLEVDLRRREARRAGEVVALTTREFDLLAFLANNVGSGALAPAAPRRCLGHRLVRRRAHGRRPRGPAAQEARLRSPPGHRLGRRLPVRLTMRRRLMLAMVGLVAVVLVIAGAGSLILTRNAARNQAEQQLVSEVNSLTSSKIASQSLRDLPCRPRRRSRSRTPTSFEIDRLGKVVAPLPEGLTAQDIDVAAVQSGQTDVGSQGQHRVRGGAGHAVGARACQPAELERAACARVARPSVTFRGHVRRPADPRRRRPRPELGVLHRRRGSGVARRRVGGLADVAAGWPDRSSRPWRPPGRIASGELASRVPVRRGDYPEFASLAGSINDMAQSLEDGRARERHLLLSVSHDLRTPLTSIRGFAEAIQDGAIADSAQAADVIIAESRRLERLVGDLLDLTKLEARPDVHRAAPDRRRRGGDHDRRRVPARRRQEQARHCAASPGAARVERASGHLLPVVADPDRLAQLLANLLENAMTFARTTSPWAWPRTRGRAAASSRSRTTGPASRQGDLRAGLRALLSGRPGPEPSDGLGARAWRSWPSWRRPWAARCAPSRPPTDDGGSRFVLTLRQWQAAAPVPSAV